VRTALSIPRARLGTCRPHTIPGMGAKLAAVIGWFGTFIGALALILALNTAPATWARHHHRLYMLLVATLVVCLMIAILGPLVLAIVAGRFWLMTWRAARRYDPRRPKATPLVAWPRHPTGNRRFEFETDRLPRRVIFTVARPAGLWITEPFEAVIWEAMLPVRVQRYGKTIFRVIEFMPARAPGGGYVIADQVPGIVVRGEVSYSEYAPAPKQPDA
jgi:hypothetical protein